MLDYSYQALFNPCESLLSDLMATAPEWEQTRGFTVYSAGISLGCIIGYLIVSIDWSSMGLLIGSQEQTAFTVIFVMFLPCLFLTLICAREKIFRRTKLSPAQSGDGNIISANDRVYEKKLIVLRQPDSLTGVPNDMTVIELSNNGSKLLRDHPSDGGYESGSSESEESSPLILPSSEMLKWRYQRIVHQIQRLPRITFQRLCNNFLRLIWKITLVIGCLPYQVCLWLRILISEML